jgi:hypothetical protein
MLRYVTKHYFGSKLTEVNNKYKEIFLENITVIDTQTSQLMGYLNTI